MPTILPRLTAHYIEIEAHERLPTTWVFLVNLILSPGIRRTLWMGTNYETAMLMAEREARRPHGILTPPLPVWDKVLGG